MKYVYIDVETTSLDHVKGGIIQIACIFEKDGEIVDSFSVRVQPKEDALIEDAALEVVGLTREDIKTFHPMSKVFKVFKKRLNNFVNPYDKEDKAFFVGFNCQKFDADYVRQWFSDNGDNFFGAYFYVPTLDVMLLAAEYLKEVRNQLPNFQLMTVAEAMGIEIDKESAHDAGYDIKITRQIYKMLTGEMK